MGEAGISNKMISSEDHNHNHKWRHIIIELKYLSHVHFGG